MLQQTRVETVIPYYERFLERFPTVDALATADEDDVLREWAGLGYYARARNLKRAAELVARDHGGALPRDADALRALPGVGRYTVGALRSIAFRERAAIVDGNVKRVLARLLAEPELPEAANWELADALVPSAHPDQFNQALMELGATVCTPRNPQCPQCPISAACQAYEAGTPEEFPAPRKRTKVREVQATAAVVERMRPRHTLLVVRRPRRGLLGGLWELPAIESGDARALADAIAERTGIQLRAADEAEPIGVVRHLFSHRALTLNLIRLRPSGGRLRRDSDTRFCGPAELAELPLSALMRKTLTLAGFEPGGGALS